jgi:hypothetical protein
MYRIDVDAVLATPKDVIENCQIAALIGKVAPSQQDRRQPRGRSL